MTDTLRSITRGARPIPDRLLHPWRQWITQRQLARTRRPGTVLFVCHGNICRSPYAAAVARRLFASGIVVESAGFIGPGRPAPAEAVAVAAERGIDLTPHRSRLIMADHLQAADLVVVMNLEQRRRLVSLQRALAARVVLLGDLDPQSITQRTVPDPVDQPAEAFRSCYDRIDRCVGLLAAPWRECGDDDVQRKGRQR